jgi:hypothetical protein
MDELRKHPRHRTFKGGSISHDHATGIACLIRNISDGGACLELDYPNELPEDFTLIIKPEFVKRDCHLAWRAGTRAGVSFS